MHSLGKFVSAALLAAAAFTASGAFAQPAPSPAPATPAPAPAAPATPDAKEPFAQEVTLTAKPIVYLKGTATWDTAFDTLVDSFKQVYTFLERQGVKPAGPAMTIYTASDDTGFEFQAAVPLAEPLKDPPQGDLTTGTSPEGKAYKFVHRGSYDTLDGTYDAITHYLDENKLEARDLYIEQYATDLLTTAEDKLVIEVLVPIK